MHEDRLAASGRDSNADFADPRRADALHALGAGARVDRFDIVDLIGGGASGYVYLAFDHALGRHIALREYLPRSIALRGTNGTVQPAAAQQAALFSAGLRSFASEALVLARIESPTLAKVLRYWEGNGTGYAAMPFYEGMTLEHAAMERRIAIDDTMLRTLLAHLLDAVEAVHRAQSCHGNISPADVLIRADGRPLLLEFDAARTVLAEMTDTVPSMLKPGYAPVELYPGMKDMLPGAWSDIYSIGAVAWFLITGKQPPSAPERLRQDRMRSAREAGHGRFSPGLLDAIDRALAVRLEQRPPSVAAMRELVGAGRALAPAVPRAQHAREAMRRDREMATRTAAQAPQPTPAPERARAETIVPAHPQPAAWQDLPPIQGEWRKLPAQPPRHPAPRARSRALPILAGAFTLCVGAVAGVLIGYPGLLFPTEPSPAPVTASAAPAAMAPVDVPAAPGLAEEPPPVTAAQTVEPPPVPAERVAAPKSTVPETRQSAAATRASEPAVAPAPDARNEPAQAKQDAAEQEEWRIASAINQPEFYDKYLKRFPDGPNAALARARLAAAQPSRSGAAAPVAAVASGSPAATSGAAAAAPVEERGSRVTAGPTRAAPASEPASPGTGRTIRSEGQTLTGDFNADPESGALSGSGRVTWANGDRYEGRLINGSKEGKGKFIWSNGQRYDGDWADNQPNGRGVIVYADGNRYEGDVRNGLPDGRGAMVYSGGGRYEGEIRNGLPHGRGSMVFADGTRYEGELRDGLPHGQGVTRFRSGDVYSGGLSRGVSHGQGRFAWANGMVWEGEFRDGARTTNGRMTSQARTAAAVAPATSATSAEE